MSYPTGLIAILNEVNGNSCGDLNHALVLDPESDPPVWNQADTGDFYFVRCLGITDGSGQMETFQLQIRYLSQDPCGGTHYFRRSPASPNDPTGNYCSYVNGQLDCNQKKASIIVNDG